ncbi:hypothetical protein ACSSV1_005040 [Labrenzia sp. MBR-25]|jgi:hypothetical protein
MSLPEREVVGDIAKEVEQVYGKEELFVDIATASIDVHQRHSSIIRTLSGCGETQSWEQHMRNGVFLSLVLAAALMGSEALAQSNGPGSGSYGRMGFGMGWGMGPNGQMPGRGRFAIIDLNDDGQISDEEAASSALEVFIVMDADDDGELTETEYMTVRMGPGQGWNPERQTRMQERKKTRFSQMDADKNGTVSRAEFLDSAKEHHMSADADGDGVVTPWEHRRRNWY